MTRRTKPAQRKHLDGSLCPEGTAVLPARHKFCCDMFRARAHACYFDVRYEWWPRQRGWFNVIMPEAGGGGIAMAFCPHCGTKLGGIRRQGRYFPV
jgi:hypothetical protein